MQVPWADNQALRAKSGVIKAPTNRGIMKMNHFHPTILIVLVERHPPRPQQIKLKCWQMTQMAEQSQECEQQTLFQPCHSHALSQRFPCETVHLRIFIFFLFWGGVFSCDKWELCPASLCNCYTTERASKVFVWPQNLYYYWKMWTNRSKF